MAQALAFSGPKQPTGASPHPTDELPRARLHLDRQREVGQVVRFEVQHQCNERSPRGAGSSACQESGASAETLCKSHASATWAGVAPRRRAIRRSGPRAPESAPPASGAHGMKAIPQTLTQLEHRRQSPCPRRCIGSARRRSASSRERARDPERSRCRPRCARSSPRSLSSTSAPSDSSIGTAGSTACS